MCSSFLTNRDLNIEIKNCRYIYKNYVWKRFRKYWKKGSLVKKILWTVFDRGYTLIGKLIEICEKLVKSKLCNKNPGRKLWYYTRVCRSKRRATWNTSAIWKLKSQESHIFPRFARMQMEILCASSN